MANKWAHIVLFIFFSNSIWAQVWVTKTRAYLPKSDELIENQDHKTTENPYLFYDDSTALFDHVVCSFFHSLKTTSGQTIKRSSLLNAVSFRVVTGLNISKANNSSKHFNFQKKIYRALIGIQKTYGYTDFTAFELKVVDLPSQYFYDDSNGDSPYHLYKGKKPNSKEIESGEAKYVPVKLYTEKELEAKILKKLKSSPFYGFCKKKAVITFGVSSFPKKRCFYRKGIPTIQVVVMVGIKRYDEKKLKSGKFNNQRRKHTKRTKDELEKIENLLRKA